MGSAGTGEVIDEMREAASKEGLWPKHRVLIKGGENWPKTLVRGLGFCLGERVEEGEE